MKKTIILAASALMLLASCDDMLDKAPRDKFVNNPEFWNNVNQVESYSNRFFEQYVGYGQSGNYGWFYFKSLSDDQVNPDFDNWDRTSVLGNDSYWSNPFTEIRRANYMLAGLKTSTLSESQRNHFAAVARLNRAWQYYQLVRMYGDVQWYEDVVMDPDPNGSQSEIIYQARTDRDVVMDHVLDDLNFAVANITTTGKNNWSVDMAQAMKSDICLYEGTYCKYRTQADNGKAADMTRANKFLNECVKASEAVMAKNYKLNANYGDIYNADDLGGNSEVIFFRNYKLNEIMHSTGDYCCSSSPQRGISKDAFDAFLFRDGKPLATTTLNKSDVPERVEYIQHDSKGKVVLDEDGKPVVLKDKDGNTRYVYSIEKMLAVRDKRLSKLVDPILSLAHHEWERAASGSSMASSTGYTIAKYDNLNQEPKDRISINRNISDAPLWTLPIIYLNFAEAKAELGTLTQTDLDNTVNMLQARADVKAISISPEADPANNMNVSNLLWEIRRARRCELMTDNWIRYWDLVRWHQLDKLDNTKYPNINRGANVKAAMAQDADIVYNVDADGYIIVNTAQRIYDKKYYFYPIPSSQITLSNGTTTQNPGW